MIRQQQLFAAHQARCLNCNVAYVPYHRDFFLRIANDVGLIGRSDIRWSADRVYQENVRYCSAECLDEGFYRRLEEHLAHMRPTIKGKRR